MCMTKLYESYLKNKEKLDTYKLLLLGLLFNRSGHKDWALNILEEVSKQQDQTGAVLNAVSSITLSRGLSLDIETTALAVILYFEAKSDKYPEFVAQATKFLSSHITNTYYVSTQATILTLIVFDQLVKGKNNGLSVNFDIFLKG